MKSKQQIQCELAALFYYQSAEREEGVAFEALAAERQKPFLEMAGLALLSISKLNLVLRPASTKNEAEVSALLRNRIEGAVRDFFNGLTVFKKGAVPQEELVARVMAVFENL